VKQEELWTTTPTTTLEEKQREQYKRREQKGSLEPNDCIKSISVKRSHNNVKSGWLLKQHNEKVPNKLPKMFFR
jgi:hypothetical protein